MSETVDFLIAGAGVVGLAVARELSSDNASVVLVERHDSFGRETSSRNSEVVHGGMYYPADSLKCLLCVEGRRLLYQYARDRRVPYAKTGKLIVAVNPQEEEALSGIYRQGRTNGVEGLSMLSARQALELEPEVVVSAALFSAETGIIDTHAYMQSLLDEAKAKGALCAFNTNLVSLERTQKGFLARVNSSGQEQELQCRVFVNCCGLDADTVAAMAGLDPDALGYRLHYCKGSYFRLSPSAGKRLKHLVYPVPKPSSGGLGIHVTVDLNGGVRLGPDDEYLDTRSQDYQVDTAKRGGFYRSVSRFLPYIQEHDLSIDTSGIRPKLQAAGQPFRDFVILDEKSRGLPGLINLVGIESPGLTSSLAIARMVRTLCKAYN